MKIIFTILSLCSFLLSFSCAKAERPKMYSPIYKSSDLPVRFYLDFYDEGTYRRYGKNITEAVENWTSLTPEVYKKTPVEKSDRYSMYSLYIVREYFRTNEEAMDWLENDRPSILGTGPSEPWKNSSFAKELSREFGYYCLGLTGYESRFAIVVKDNVVIRVDLSRKFSKADEKKIVRKSLNGEVLGDYIEFDFIGLLRKLLSRL